MLCLARESFLFWVGFFLRCLRSLDSLLRATYFFSHTHLHGYGFPMSGPQILLCNGICFGFPLRILFLTYIAAEAFCSFVVCFLFFLWNTLKRMLAACFNYCLFPWNSFLFVCYCGFAFQTWIFSALWLLSDSLQRKWGCRPLLAWRVPSDWNWKEASTEHNYGSHFVCVTH